MFCDKLLLSHSIIALAINIFLLLYIRTLYSKKQILKMINDSPELDYVGEYLMGRILGNEDIKIQMKELNKIGRSKKWQKK